MAVHRGTRFDLGYLLTNTGNGTDSLDVGLTVPSGWQVQGPTPRHVLEPDGTAQGTISVTVPEGTATGAARLRLVVRGSGGERTRADVVIEVVDPAALVAAYAPRLTAGGAPPPGGTGGAGRPRRTAGGGGPRERRPPIGHAAGLAGGRGLGQRLGDGSRGRAGGDAAAPGHRPRGQRAHWRRHDRGGRAGESPLRGRGGLGMAHGSAPRGGGRSPVPAVRPRAGRQRRVRSRSQRAERLRHAGAGGRRPALPRLLAGGGGGNPRSPARLCAA